MSPQRSTARTNSHKPTSIPQLQQLYSCDPPAKIHFLSIPVLSTIWSVPKRFFTISHLYDEKSLSAEAGLCGLLIKAQYTSPKHSNFSTFSWCPTWNEFAICPQDDPTWSRRQVRSQRLHHLQARQTHRNCTTSSRFIYSAGQRTIFSSSHSL